MFQLCSTFFAQLLIYIDCDIIIPKYVTTYRVHCLVLTAHIVNFE